MLAIRSQRLREHMSLSILGTKGDLPDEVFEQMVQAQADKSAMHQLYCQYLGARGNWQQSTLVLAVRKRHAMTLQETWTWLTKEGLVKQLGSRELAEDLIKRHVETEQLPKNKGKFIRVNPDWPGRQELWFYRCFKGIEETKTKAIETEGTVSMTADIEDDDAAAFMCLAYKFTNTCTNTLSSVVVMNKLG